MRGKKVRFLIFVVLSVATLLFIWSNSMRNASSSTEQSGRVAAFLAEHFDLSRPVVGFLYRNLRKAAHFSEFAMLGFFLGGAAFVRADRKWLSPLCGTGMATVAAAIDEGIQFFVPGRYASVWDVCLDTTGAFCGTLAVFFCGMVGIALCRRKK